MLKVIAESATALINPLAPLGLYAQKINKCSLDVDSFYQIITSKEKQVTRLKNTIASVEQLVKNCRLMLRNDLDTAVNTFKLSQEEFWFLYHNSRRLVHLGGKRNYYTVIITGKVCDAKTKKLFDNVTITPETKGKSTVTANKGKFNIKMYKKYAKALHFTCDGYEPLRVALPAKIKAHKLEVNAVMKKVDK